MPSPDDEPLIHTSKGNLPLASLLYHHYRRDVPGIAVLVEEWWLGAEFVNGQPVGGEMVRNNVHALPLVGVCLEGAQGGFQ